MFCLIQQFMIYQMGARCRLMKISLLTVVRYPIMNTYFQTIKESLFYDFWLSNF